MISNSSATSAYEVLNDNGGVGLTFETEGDTLADTLKTDYGMRFRGNGGLPSHNSVASRQASAPRHSIGAGRCRSASGQRPCQ